MTKLVRFWRVAPFWKWQIIIWLLWVLWTALEDRYEMILLRIVVFSDHLIANFWNSQEPIIVYEVSWLSFDNLILYHVVHYVSFNIWKKAEVQDQYHLSLNPDQKANDLTYWIIIKTWVVTDHLIAIAFGDRKVITDLCLKKDRKVIVITELGTVIKITQPPSKEGAGSALNSNLSKSGLD